MSEKPRKFLFLIQGEGRGHMTQAIGLYQMLVKNGHEVPCVFIGVSNKRKIPNYFFDSIKSTIHQIDSPNFISDKNNKSIKLGYSILYNSFFLKKYFRSLQKLNEAVLHYKPDAIINFYDFLGGFYNYFYRPDSRYITIGHQFLTDRSDYEYVKGRLIEKFLFRTYNKLCSLNAYKKLAMSLVPLDPSQFERTLTVPPLLRLDLTLKKTLTEDFLLGYMVNDGYSQEIIEWQKENPDIRIHCFWDKNGEPEEKKINKNLVFHQLNADLFIDYMCRCKGFITTAGFESICEAMYFGKPVFMVPVSGQYEQASNALNAKRAGAGISASNFNISGFLDYIQNHNTDNTAFKNWLGQAEKIIIHALTVY